MINALDIIGSINNDPSYITRIENANEIIISRLKDFFAPLTEKYNIKTGFRSMVKGRFFFSIPTFKNIEKIRPINTVSVDINYETVYIRVGFEDNNDCWYMKCELDRNLLTCSKIDFELENNSTLTMFLNRLSKYLVEK